MSQWWRLKRVVFTGVRVDGHIPGIDHSDCKGKQARSRRQSDKTQIAFFVFFPPFDNYQILSL